ncbi:MAG: FAD-dependent oxidoreductase [Methylococcales symbiont of Iophon sp. n. MRB-2018]|nr:MAG: FAD-dependent oxidoreductase [Methylococcales symbiont of Iophon sp. n. MRB-2018]
MAFNPDITIIGGGIIGLLSAKEFVEAGCQVSLIDKSLTGKESSWAGGGILLPLYPWRQVSAISSLVVESIKRYAGLAEQLFNSTAIDPEWLDCGIFICKNPDINLATEWCIKHQVLFHKAEHSLYKNLNTQVNNPLWLPEIAQIRNPRLLKSLKAFLLKKNVQFIENCTISDCLLNHNRIESLATDQGKINVNQLIICAGAWSKHLIKQLLSVQHLPDIAPVKGQMLLFDAQPDTLAQMILDDAHYLIPRRDGKILVGSSVEHCQFDKSTSLEAKNKLHAFATKLFPALNNTPVINHWAGLRPGTSQGVPYISKHPEIKNLSINAGHFRNGLVTAPASAQLMADLILGRQPSINPKPYTL